MTSTAPQGRRLVLLRHGRTAWNHAKRVQGQTDVSLDDEGVRQAASAAPIISGFGPVRLWCSDLLRARLTVEPLAQLTGLAPTYDPRLREFTLGSREGLTHEEYADLAPDEFARFLTGDFDAVVDGERTSVVRARMVDVLTEALASLKPGETGVVVSHGAAVRVATAAMLGWADDQFHSLRGLDNCGWAVLEDHPVVPGLKLSAYNRAVTG